MRLRLIVNRNGLPTMKIWWDTSSFQPGDDRNISSLLVHVSQIVPLESSRWGLEDYAVEIDGFECLHFQEVKSVIREGDEVVIRPLSSHEIKQRRLSGRRQISTSGRKLLDGTPFGRSFLRPAPDRPTLAIPPRKRRRIGQADADDLITVQVEPVTDENYKEDEDDADDTEEYPSSEEVEEVFERQLVPARMDPIMNGGYLLEKGEGGNGRDGEEEVAANGGEYDNPLMDYYYDTASEVESDPDEEEELRRIVGEGSSSSEKDVEQETLPKSRNIPIDILAASSDSSDDEDFDPDASQSSDSSSDEEEEEEATAVAQAVTPVVEDPQAQPLNISSIAVPSDDEVYSSPEPSSSPSSSSSSSEDSSSEEGSSSSSSSSEESPSSSSSSGEESEDKIVFQPEKQKQKPQSRSSSTSSSSPSSPSSPYLEPHQEKKLVPRLGGPPVSPGSLPNEGKKSTKARNQRKHINRKLRKLKESGAVPIDMNRAGYLAQVAGNQVAATVAAETPKHTESAKIATPVKAPVKGPGKPKSEEAVKAANRRKRYRRIYSKAKKAGNTDLDFDKWAEEREQQRLAEIEKEKEKGKGKEKGVDGDTTMEPTDNAPTEESSKQKITGRPSVDISAIQRILHHDLPITKKKTTEEEIMRKEWAAAHRGDTTNKGKGFAREQFGKKPKKIVYDEDGNPVPVSVEQEVVGHEGEDPDAWREKIILTAVECEWKDVELPEPTYPFKQPSFPQSDAVAGQKRKRGGGKKKKQQEDWEYYGYSQNDGCYQQEHQRYDDWGNHDYYDDTTYHTNDQATRDTVMEDSTPVDDLPPLPADLSTLPPLTKPILPGTVVAFKQLTMDKNYTPVLADYRTAIIEEAIDEEPDGPFLVMRLAIRDRIEREVDKNTGEKVMRKFEMPGDTRADEGKEEIMWGELINPLLVKLPECPGASANSNENGSSTGGENGDKNRSYSGQDGIDTADVDGTEEAMDDAPDGEQQDETEKGKDEEPTFEQGIFETAIETVEEDHLSAKIAAILEKEEEQALLEELAAEMAVGEDGHPVIGISQEQVLDTPQDAQITNSPKYSHSYIEFKTPEPELEAQVDNTPVVGGRSHVPLPLVEESPQQSAYESDSDGLPTLESILTSQSQRASIKRESQTHDEPQLPPLPVFSPFGVNVGQEEERPLDEQQIQHEVEGAKKGDIGKGPPKNNSKSGSSQVQVIGLTITSSDPAEEISKKRGRGRGRKKGGSEVWRVIKD